MVDDLVRPAQLPVLVADRVEAVRAGGHDRPLAHPVAVERLDVARRQHLEDVVVAHPPGRVAGARLLLAEDREADARRVEARRDRPGDLLVARVERRRAADPVQDLELVEPAGRRHRRHGRDLERQRLRPVEPRRRRLAPRVALVLHRPERAGQLGREPDSSRTRFRRSPTILSTCSMRTGQASTHAPQVTQSQTASYGIALSTIGLASVGRGDGRVVEAVRLAHDRRVRDDVDPVLGIHRHVRGCP